MATSGLDLRLERVAARVKLKDLAAAMGKDRRTVGAWEVREVVDADLAVEYREALATFSDVPTTGTAA